MQSEMQSRGHNPHIVTLEDGGHTVSMIPNPYFDKGKNLVSPVIPPKDDSIFGISITKSFAEEIERSFKEAGGPVILTTSHGKLNFHFVFITEDFFEDLYVAMVTLETPRDVVTDPITDVQICLSSYSFHMMAVSGAIVYDNSGGSYYYPVKLLNNGL